jgi:phospholipid/cholesterol/gamma-HCH transport system ATP-binding protein
MAHTNGPPAIQISHLWKSFGRQQVLQGIDLTVRRGETLVILGRSGTGKSVLLKIVVGLQKQDSGSVKIDGEEITNVSPQQLNEIRKRIGFLFQYSALFDSMSVEQNVAFPLRRHSKMQESAIKDRVYELLSRVGVESSAAKLPSEVSGGMRKRVALARALALFPQFLLCDEPTAGLDPITSGEIDSLIKNLQKNYQMSSLVVTHDLQSARTISDRVAMLHKGDFLFEGPFDDLVRSDNDFIRKFVQPILAEAR